MEILRWYSLVFCLWSSLLLISVYSLLESPSIALEHWDSILSIHNRFLDIPLQFAWWRLWCAMRLWRDMTLLSKPHRRRFLWSPVNWALLRWYSQYFDIVQQTFLVAAKCNFFSASLWREWFIGRANGWREIFLRIIAWTMRLEILLLD